MKLPFLNGHNIGNSAFVDDGDCNDDVNEHEENVSDERTTDNEAYIEFEDMLENTQDVVQNPTVMFEGKQVYKASILKIISDKVGLSKSGDRLKRIQGISKFQVNTDQANEDSPSKDSIITIKDPFCTILHGSRGISLVVILADCIHDPQKKQHTFVENGGSILVVNTK